MRPFRPCWLCVAVPPPQTVENATARDCDQRSQCTQQQERVFCNCCPFLLRSLVLYYASKNTRQSVGVKRFLWRLFMRAAAKNSAVQSSRGLNYAWNMKSQRLALVAVPDIIKTQEENTVRRFKPRFVLKVSCCCGPELKPGKHRGLQCTQSKRRRSEFYPQENSGLRRYRTSRRLLQKQQTVSAQGICGMGPFVGVASGSCLLSQERFQLSHWWMACVFNHLHTTPFHWFKRPDCLTIRSVWRFPQRDFH